MTNQSEYEHPVELVPVVPVFGVVDMVDEWNDSMSVSEDNASTLCGSELDELDGSEDEVEHSDSDNVCYSDDVFSADTVPYTPLVSSQDSSSLVPPSVEEGSDTNPLLQSQTESDSEEVEEDNDTVTLRAMTTCSICEDPTPLDIAWALHDQFEENRTSFVSFDNIPFLKCIICGQFYHFACIVQAGELAVDSIDEFQLGRDYVCCQDSSNEF